MAILPKNISIFIENYFPRYFQEEADTLIKFVEYYYEFLEENGQSTDVLRELHTYRDSQITPDEFYNFLRDEFLANFPTMLVDERLLIRRVVDFYKAKGSENAYRLLFRILFNEEITFYYPGDDILRSSDGRWVRGNYVSVTKSDDYTVEEIKLIPSIEGETSGATGRIRDVAFTNDSTIYNIYMNEFNGVFVEGEDLIDVSSNTAFATITSNGMLTEQGYFLGTNGFLSSDKRLQDNRYYQEFSYEIISSKPVNAYREAIKSLIHPSGTKLFGRIIFDEMVDVSNTSIFSSTFLGEDIEGVLEFEVLIEAFANCTSANLTFRDNFGWIDLTSANNIGPGEVSIFANNTIATYSGVTINTIAFIPIGVLGTNELVIGNNTSFTTDFTSYANGTLIQIGVSGPRSLYLAKYVFNDEYLQIDRPYANGTVINSDYKTYALHFEDGAEVED